MTPVAMVVAGDPETCRRLAECAESRGFACSTAGSGEEALGLYVQTGPDLVLLDSRLPGMGALQVLEQMRQLDPGGRVVLLDPGEDAERRAEAMELGAGERAILPLPLSQLGSRLEELRLEIGQAGEATRLAGVIGQSEAMQAIFRMIHRVARTKATVLVRGESGTGKELIARAIHVLGHEPHAPFVTVDCTHIPATLMESELCGHERGAFTDAKVRKKGLMELADGGTLFLDEIGLLPLELQTKLLSILETQRFRRVGGTEEIEVAVRFLAATNENLEEAVREGRFREDLYYRLNVVPVDLPPLRERGRDVLLLAYYYLTLYTVAHDMPVRRFTDEARDLLQVYPWPGNVRELKNVIERAVLMTEGELIHAEHLIIDRRSRKKATAPAGNLRIDPQGEIAITFPPQGVSLERVERELIQAALVHTGGNVTQAAALLHLSRDTLRYRMAKYQEDGSEG